MNIAAALARRGMKTLLVDADPQGSVRYGLGLHARDDSRRPLRLPRRHARDAGRRAHDELPWLRVVRAGSVSEAGRHEELSRDQLADSRALAELFDRARERGYLVIVDTPPGLGPVVHRVLRIAASTRSFRCSASRWRCRRRRRSCAAFARRSRTNPGLVLEGILLTMVEDGNPVSERVAAYVREQLPGGLGTGCVGSADAASVEAFAAGQPLVLRSPDDRGGESVPALADRLATGCNDCDWDGRALFGGDRSPSSSPPASTCADPERARLDLEAAAALSIGGRSAT